MGDEKDIWRRMVDLEMCVWKYKMFCDVGALK